MDEKLAVVAPEEAPRRYWLRSEVRQHNSEHDCWVSAFGVVFDLTDLVQANKGVLTDPLLRLAGRDVSHWFHPRDKTLCTHIDPVTGLVCPFTPDGRFVHVPPPVPTLDWSTDYDVPWWADPALVVGRLSQRGERLIKVVNTLSRQEDTIKVCGEETLEEILQRTLPVNAHAASYTWKFLGRVLSMDKTLDENGVEDEQEEFEALHLPDTFYIPSLFLYFNDDLTVA